MKEPKIRLKGFSGEWEETTFGNRLLSIQTGTNLLGSMDNKGVPLLKMGNIQRGYFSFDKLERLDESITPADNCIANYGDFFYNTRNTLELVGKGATWMEKKGVFAFNSNIARCSLDGINTIFFNYLYNTRYVIKQVQARAKGTTSVAAVYQRDLDSIKFSLPSVKEQNAIGAYFHHLDTLIQSTTKKIESLKQVKAASLQSMFPQEGETTPRVRFKGFEGEWETVSLNSLCRNAASQLTESTLGENKGCYPVFGASGYLQNIEEYAFDVPYIGIIKDGSGVGRSQLYPACSSILGTMQYIIPNSGIDASYLACVFEGIDLTKFITGSTIPHIYFRDYCTLQLMMPSEEEQKKIGKYFTNLDSQITLQTQRLEKLKQIKSACLDNMFV
ncbi:MAG: restriction endonuclease subunit S [Bacteroidaceae bacterium]|nr:restriction endonuclease subunit S [Bacteroidaceae bacterium]